jgi:hypothetical protein
MMKRNYSKLQAWDVTVIAKAEGKSEMVFKGRNSNGRDCTVTIDIEDYFFPYMVRDMMKVVQGRINRAVELKQNIKSETL